jgi:hypothetical protein
MQFLNNKALHPILIQVNVKETMTGSVWGQMVDLTTL